MYQMISDFKSKPPTNEEIKEIKEELLKELDYSFNSGNTKFMENVLDLMNDNGNYITYEAYKQMIESLTPQNVYEMTGCLDLNRAAVVVSHPKGSTKESIQDVDKKYPYSVTPIDISANNQSVNYQFVEHCNQITGDKFYSTTLQDGSRAFFVNSPDEKCRINWRLSSEDSYSSNPASKFILNYFNSVKLFGAALYSAQDQIENFIDCDLKDLIPQNADENKAREMPPTTSVKLEDQSILLSGMDHAPQPNATKSPDSSSPVAAASIQNVRTPPERNAPRPRRYSPVNIPIIAVTTAGSVERIP
jgi:hypothetical protein